MPQFPAARRSMPDVRATAAAPIPAFPRQRHVPLSFSQERLLTDTAVARLCLNAASPFNLFVIRQLIGPLDIQVLQRALNLLVARHACLRSAIWPAVSPGQRLAAAKAYLSTGRVAPPPLT